MIMDLIVYIIVITVFGFIRMSAKQTVQEKYSIIGDGVTVDSQVTSGDLKIGSNLRLLRDKDAFTLILEELGLK